jgi:hypothetical protein
VAEGEDLVADSLMASPLLGILLANLEGVDSGVETITLVATMGVEIYLKFMYPLISSSSLLIQINSPDSEGLGNTVT